MFEICRDCLQKATVKTIAGENFCETCYRNLQQAIAKYRPQLVILKRELNKL
jgi:hypothetical protein